jgi:hypothetical protein
MYDPVVEIYVGPIVFVGIPFPSFYNIAKALTPKHHVGANESFVASD